MLLFFVFIILLILRVGDDMNHYNIIYSVIIDQTEICDEIVVTAVNFGFAVMQIIDLVKLNLDLDCIINWIQKI